MQDKDEVNDCLNKQNTANLCEDLVSLCDIIVTQLPVCVRKQVYDMRKSQDRKEQKPLETHLERRLGFMVEFL